MMGEQHRKKRKCISFRFDDEVYKLLKEKANTAETNLTDFVTSLIKKSEVIEVRKIEPEMLREISYEINRIGNNINQIVYHVNSRGGGCTRYELNTLLFEIRKVEELFIFALKGD